MSNLSPEMQARLERWQKTRTVSKPAAFWDHGDDIKDYNAKEQEMWKREREQYQRN